MNSALPGNPKIRILIVEDHRAFAENLFEFLGDDLYELDYTDDGLSAYQLIRDNHYDVIVLDVMIPGTNGFDLCRKIRDELGCRSPVIYITARASLLDKEMGFLAGGDDYLVKPFDLRELQLRIDAVYRRMFPADEVLLAGDIAFDHKTLTVTLPDSRTAELSSTGARIFEALIRSYPGISSGTEISTAIWGHGDGDSHAIRTHIYNLRKHLEGSLGSPLIKTKSGRGYSLCPTDECTLG